MSVGLGEEWLENLNCSRRTFQPGDLMTLGLSSAPVVCSTTRWITLGWNPTRGLFSPSTISTATALLR